MVGWGRGWAATIDRDYQSMPFPKQFPAYRTLLVDAPGNLWVEDYPRARSLTTRWSVFDMRGELLTEVRLPRDLTVFEIGMDYIVGRYLDPQESIPEVRVYGLRRGS